jgi:hypothetical protein
LGKFPKPPAFLLKASALLLKMLEFRQNRANLQARRQTGSCTGGGISNLSPFIGMPGPEIEQKRRKGEIKTGGGEAVVKPLPGSGRISLFQPIRFAP